jgi:hypothetical protein
MRWLLLLFVGVLMRETLQAQTMNLSDSLREVFRQRITPSFKFDTRNSFITGSTAKVYGIKAGVNFGKRLSIGLGYNFIGTELQENVWENDRETPAEIRMNYVAPYVEYSFYQRGPWELSAPIQLGMGTSFLHVTDENGSRVLNRSRVILYEPGMAFEFKILKVIGVGAGFGYRIMLKNNRAIEQQFTSPVYALRARLIFDELYRRYKKYNSDTEEK